jgi:DNA-binding NtrC family response regulator
MADCLLLWERDYWAGLLAVTRSVPKAAKIAGWNRTTLYRRLNQLGIPYPRLRHEGKWSDLL